MPRAGMIGVAAMVMAMACGPGLRPANDPASRMPALPSQWGPRWVELTSPHFTLWTDCTEDRARELIHELEQVRQVVVGTAFHEVPDTARNFVIAVRDSDELAAFAPGETLSAGAGPHVNGIHQAFTALAAHTPYGEEELVTIHEVAHLVSYARIRDQPMWLAEGLATYFETMRIDLRDSTIDLGYVPTRRYAMNPDRVDLRKAFACASRECMNDDFFITSWILYSYLTSERPADLAFYLNELAAGRDAADSFARTFPGPLEDLQRALRTWMASGRHLVRHFTVQLGHWSVRERALGDADVLAVKALLGARSSSIPRAQVLADADAALRLDPTHVLAATLAAAHRAIPSATAKAIVAAHPDDFQAWRLAGAALDDADAARAARARACALAATNPVLEVPRGWCQPGAAAPATGAPPAAPGAVSGGRG